MQEVRRILLEHCKEVPGSRLEETVMAQAEGSELRTIYAGYHWFGDWGRDTMISFEGLTLVCGRFREAVRWARKALDSASEEQALTFRDRLEMYQADQPYRAPRG